jgi:hypothetical protein
MRRIIIIVLGITLLTTTAWVVRGAAAGSTAESTHSAAARAPATIRDQSGQRKALYQSELEQNILHQHPGVATTGDAGSLASQLARARLATAKYATSLPAAKAAGYQLITRMLPDMGWHFLNPTIQGFDVAKPPILVYERHGRSWQLGALEWVFTQTPPSPPLPGATYGSFPAACHYKDGTFGAAASQDLCPRRSPRAGPGSASGIRTW